MKNQLNEVTTPELLQLIHSSNIKLIDVRPIDAYNGWPMLNEKRGGHIKTAKSLPLKWSRYIDWIEVVRHKKIIPEDDIVIYGYSREDALSVGKRFINSGYHKVKVYYGFKDEWSVDTKLPMEKLERFQHLVSPRWLNMLLSGEHPPYYPNNHYLLVHAHYRNRDAYLSGHIPGAIDMDTLALEAPETWNRRSPEELQKALEHHGISSDTTVVLYGKFMFPDNDDPFPGSAAGDIGAIRLAMIMLYAGVKDVRVLNGGFQSWEDEGFEISTEDEPKAPVADFGVSVPMHSEIIVDTPQAKKMLTSSDAELVCVRSWPEYIGEVSGYNYIEQKGRIPGAVFGDCGSDAYHMENYRNLDHTTREYHEIADIWLKNNISPDKHLAFYCGTGWRGSEAWFNAWLMGWPRVSVYDGGWYEWSRDPENPFETGVPADMQ